MNNCLFFGRLFIILMVLHSLIDCCKLKKSVVLLFNIMCHGISTSIVNVACLIWSNISGEEWLHLGILYVSYVFHILLSVVYCLLLVPSMVCSVSVYVWKKYIFIYTCIYRLFFLSKW